jgi:hypothetical protein
VSDHEHEHEHERGAHEIDKLPNARLFNLLFGLSALVLVSSIGVIQLFNMQVAGIERSRAKQVSFRLQEYRDEVGRVQGNWGTATVLEESGEETAVHHMPLAEARRRVLDKPELLGAAPKARGWENTAVGKSIAAEQEKLKAAMPPALPTEREPAGDQPVEEKPVEQKPVDGEQKPAEEKPAEEKPAAQKPAEKPADDDHGHDHDH